MVELATAVVIATALLALYAVHGVSHLARHCANFHESFAMPRWQFQLQNFAF